MAENNQDRQTRKHQLLYATVFFCFLSLYVLTAQRGAGWQDSGSFQVYVLTGTYIDLCGGGLAVVHPWYLSAARFFALWFPAKMQVYAVNLFSGLGLAVAVLLVLILVHRMTQNRVAGVVAAVTLGLAQMPWWLGTVAEVYTWALAFLLAEMFCLWRICQEKDARLCRRWWVALAAVNGLHASVHNVAFLNLPVYAVLGWVQNKKFLRRPMPIIKHVGGCAVAWGVGACLLVTLLVKDLHVSRSLVASLRSLFFGKVFASAVMGTKAINIHMATSNLALASVSFVSPCWLLIFRGGKDWRQGRTFKNALLAVTLIQALFWVRYFVPDQATFMLPTIGLCAVWLGFGVSAFLASGGRWRVSIVLSLLGMGIICQVVLPLVLARSVGQRGARSRVLPFRDEARYWLVPWKHNETSAQQFALAVDKQLHEGDVLVSDLTAANPIQVACVTGAVKKEWRLVSAWSGETEDEIIRIVVSTLNQGGRVFVVSPVAGYVPRKLLSEFEFQPDGVLWRVKEQR